MYPLVKEATATLVRTYPAPDPASAWQLAGSEGLGIDEYRAIAYGIDRRGALRMLNLKDDRPLPPVPIPGLDGARVSAVGYGGHSRYVIGTSDGRVIPLEMTFEAAFAGGQRTVTPRPVFGEPSVLDADGKRPIQALTSAVSGSGPVTIAQVGPAELVVHTTVEKKALVGPSAREESRQTLRLEVGGAVTKLALDGRAEDLFVGTSQGQVVRYDMRDLASPARVEVTDVAGGPDVPVTALGFLIGDRTLVVGDGSGGVVDLAGRSAAGRRPAAPHPDLRVRAPQGRRHRFQRVEARQGLRHR